MVVKKKLDGEKQNRRLGGYEANLSILAIHKKFATESVAQHVLRCLVIYRPVDIDYICKCMYI